MPQIFSAFPNKHPNKILCYYVNSTEQVQIIKIRNPHHFCFERVVFPGQKLLFEARPDDQLEIFAGGLVSACLADTLLCEELKVQHENCHKDEDDTISIPS